MKPSNSSATKAVVKKKPNKVGVIITIVASVILIIAVVFGLLVIRKYSRAEKDTEFAQDAYNPTSSQNVNVDNPDKDPNADLVGGTTSKETDPNTGITRDFEELYKINPDIKGWISIPNTGLDQPVVQGHDNAEYLNLNIKKQKAGLGIPFVDWRATIEQGQQSDVLTIYGHAAANGTYFAPVKKFKDIEYYKTHPTLNFNTVYGDGIYKIIGFFMEDVGSDNTKMFNYHDKIELTEKDFNAYISEMNKRSYFNTGVDVKYGDQLVALSTCDEDVIKGTATPFRVVLVARKVRDGESAKVDTSKATINKAMVMPDKWVSAKGKANPYQ